MHLRRVVCWASATASCSSPSTALGIVEALARGEPIPLGTGNEQLFSIEIAAGSTLDGLALKDLRQDVVVVSVVRKASELIPRGDTTVTAGDHVVVAGTSRAIARFSDLAGAH